MAYINRLIMCVIIWWRLVSYHLPMRQHYKQLSGSLLKTATVVMLSNVVNAVALIKTNSFHFVYVKLLRNLYFHFLLS